MDGNTVGVLQDELNQVLQKLANAQDEWLPQALIPLRKLLQAAHGFEPIVTVRRREDMRKFRRDAAFKNYDPDQIAICIEFEPSAEHEHEEEEIPVEAEMHEVIGNRDYEPQEISGNREYPPREISGNREYGPRDERMPLQANAEVPPEQLEDVIRALHKAEQMREFVALKWYRDNFLIQEGLPWVDSTDACQRAITAAIRNGLIVTRKVSNPRNPDFPVTAIAVNASHAEVRAILGNDVAAPRYRRTPVPMPQSLRDRR